MNEDEQKHPSQYLNDLEEWQEHQYNPGYWTGGTIPPILKYPRKPLGIMFILIGVFSMLGMLVPIILYRESFLDNASNIILGTLFGVVFILAGVKIVHKKKGL